MLIILNKSNLNIKKLIEDDTDRVSSKDLNYLYTHGWELISVVDGYMCTKEYYFKKREMKNDINN